MARDSEAFDYIVVGAGSAGCVLANRLTEEGDIDVLLLEAGEPDEADEIHVPARFPQLFKTDVDWNYTTTPQDALGGREIYWPRGKTLGGSSSINGMIYIRGHPSDYDEWAARGNDGWGYDDLLPYFKRAENFEPGADTYHGSNGPLNVTELADPHPFSDASIDAAVATGFSQNDDFNGERQEGVGYYHVTQKDGQRHSTAAAYIHPALDRQNLTVETSAQATAVRFDGDRAVGVIYEQDGETHQADATSEVLVSAGAVNSPQLLMLSGVGPADHLREHGIDVVADRPGVGRNLQDHLFAFVIHERVSGPEEPAPSSNLVEAGGFECTSDDAEAPDRQYFFAPAYFMNHGMDNPDDGMGFSIGTTQLRPKSRGRITLASADPFDQPDIDPNYLSESADLNTLVDGVQRAREIARAAPLDDYRGEEIWPGEDVQTREEIAQHVRDTCHTVYHPVGTCRMGDDDHAVVDDELRVHGVSDLRVVDASIMPTMIGGNTNAPTIAIAERAADLIMNT